EALRREAEITAKFTKAEHVRRVFRVSEKGLLLEGMTGGTLRDHIGRTPFTPDERAKIAQDLIKGLIEIHEMGYIHRDIHSQNLFLSGEAVAKIGDLECADTLGRIDNGQGSFHTFSPERIHAMVTMEARKNRKDDDLWSLGLALYELEHGTLPP